MSLEKAVQLFQEGWMDALDGKKQKYYDKIYLLGYEAGCDELVREREELDRSGSSNA